MDPDVVTVEILPILLEMAADPVPNIRFNVARELVDITPICGKTVYETQVSPMLSMMMEDQDRDVRFYAEKTMRSLEEKFSK